MTTMSLPGLMIGAFRKVGSLRASDFATLLAAPGDDGAAAALSWYMILTPFLWSLGLLIPVGFLLILWLLAWRWPVDGLINLVVAAWLLVAAMQVAAVIWNWSLTGESLFTLPRRLVSFTITGWLLLGVIMALGYAYDLARPSLIRATMVLGLYIAMFTVISLPLATLFGLDSLSFSTPMRMALGASPSADFYTSAVIFHREATLGMNLPRLMLFYPWPTTLGLAGIAIFLISYCEDHRWWRAVGMAGGICAAVFSLSRAAWVALPIAWFVLFCLRAKPVSRSWMVVAASVIGLVFVMADIHPVKLVHEASTTFAEARSGSSMARDLIYEHSWNGFLSSPLFGKGWIGKSILAEETLPIGSHSSVYGTLYTGGAMTFGAMVLAAVLTLMALLFRAVQGSPQAAAAFAIMCALTLFSYGESLFSLVLPCMFLFLFTGGALRKNAAAATVAAVSGRKVSWNPR